MGSEQEEMIYNPRTNHKLVAHFCKTYIKNMKIKYSAAASHRKGIFPASRRQIIGSKENK